MQVELVPRYCQQHPCLSYYSEYRTGGFHSECDGNRLHYGSLYLSIYGPTLIPVEGGVAEGIAEVSIPALETKLSSDQR